MAKPTKDLIRGNNEPDTIKTYATNGFKHGGVTGSKPVSRESENGAKGITPDVMKMPSVPVKKIVKDTVTVKPQGEGMKPDSGKVKR